MKDETGEAVAAKDRNAPIRDHLMNVKPTHMTNRSQSFQKDFEAAKSGSGSRAMEPAEALSFLDFCIELGWIFQSIEAFKIEGDIERLDLDVSLLGLSSEEKEQSNVIECRRLVERRIRSALNSQSQYRLKIWIDEIHSTLNH